MTKDITRDITRVHITTTVGSTLLLDTLCLNK